MKSTRKVIFVSILLFLFTASAFSQQTAEEFYQKGLEFVKKGRYKESIPYFDEALKINTNYVKALLERSRSKSNNQSDLQGALTDVETILQIEPQFGEAFFERALIRKSLFMNLLKEKGGMPTDEAIPYFKLELEDLNSAINYGFKNKRTYTYRAEIQWRNLDNYKEAIKDYTAALTFDPDDPDLLISRSTAKRNDDDTQGSIDDLREIINRYDSAKNNPQIPKQKLEQLKNASVRALINLSSTYALAEKPDLQLWAIEKSIELEPTHSAYISLARHKMIYGNLDDSIADYTKAIELSYARIGSYFMNRGVIYHLAGKIIEAEADFAQAKKLDKNISDYDLKYWIELAKRQREQKKVRVELPN